MFWTCWEGERLPGAPRHKFWWEQEFDLDLEAMIDILGSDVSTVSEESWGWGGVGLGVERKAYDLCVSIDTLNFLGNKSG